MQKKQKCCRCIDLKRGVTIIGCLDIAKFLYAVVLSKNYFDMLTYWCCSIVFGLMLYYKHNETWRNAYFVTYALYFSIRMLIDVIRFVDDAPLSVISEASVDSCQHSFDFDDEYRDCRDQAEVSLVKMDWIMTMTWALLNTYFVLKLRKYS